MIYIIAAILIFGVLIAVHELGHFLAAKACGVRVNEFSIGMGPTILHKTKGDTTYSLRLLPIGGFCAMEGEEEDSNDPTALNNQSFWKKLIIFAAGAFMNFLTGLIIIVVLYAGAKAFYVPVITDFADGCPLQSESGLQVGDRLVSIDGERVYVYSDVSLLLGRNKTGVFDLNGAGGVHRPAGPDLHGLRPDVRGGGGHSGNTSPVQLEQRRGLRADRAPVPADAGDR